MTRDLSPKVPTQCSDQNSPAVGGCASQPFQATLDCQKIVTKQTTATLTVIVKHLVMGAGYNEMAHLRIFLSSIMKID